MNPPAAQANVVVVGCSARKLITDVPVPALELYQGWCFPQLRARVGNCQALRQQVAVLSARHGLISADTPLLPYDQPLTADRAAAIAPSAVRALAHRLAAASGGELLVLLEPDYLRLLLPAVLAGPSSATHWIASPDLEWPRAEAVLTRWGWPNPPEDWTRTEG
jgi:hypothetical protein